MIRSISAWRLVNIRMAASPRPAAVPLRDTGEELVYERGEGRVGLERVAPRTVFALLRLMAIHMESGSRVGEFERYTINETGVHLLENS